MVTVLQWSFFGTLVRHGSIKICLLNYCYTKTHQIQSWPFVLGVRTIVAEKSAHACHDIVKSHGTHINHLHQPPYSYFQNKPFVTANSDKGPLSWIINHKKLIIKCKFRQMFVARTRKIKRKFRETVKMYKCKIC
jgi:hypothetical protein